MTSPRQFLQHLRSTGTALAGALLVACGGADSDDESTSSASATGPARAAALALPPAQAALARWTAPIKLSLVPVAGAMLPNGKVLFWSAEERFQFYSANGRTYTSLFDPATSSATERLVSETGHNMFCPGTTNLPDGRILVNGGIDSPMTSLYDPAADRWTRSDRMIIPRGYQANTLLPDGSVLTLGGSWSGEIGGKHGEVWTTDGGWRRLSGVPIDGMTAYDPSRAFGGDSHMWLMPADNGRVFQAGPAVNMHWISTTGTGDVEFAGRRGDDDFSVNGTAVMYEPGKILKAGGAQGYEGMATSAKSYVIDLNQGATVRKIAPMAYRRAFHNSVVLPNGQVVVIGGQTFEQAFTDNNSVLAAELFDPATESWTTLPEMSVPRNYHSIALLLPDARVLSGGGGLCGPGCEANHADVQILSPHYLFNANGSAASRPVINDAPASVGYGVTMRVTTDRPVTAFSMVRLSSVTHTVNNDQRRVPIQFTAAGANNWDLSVPSNPGILLPGYWMLFAMDSAGTPSIAKIVRVDASGAPRLEPIDDQNTSVGTLAWVDPKATAAIGAGVVFSATGLPPGVAIDAGSGRISGAPSVQDRYKVTVSARAGNQTTSTTFLWTVRPQAATRFVKFEALSTADGGALASMAEFNLLDPQGRTLSRSGWSVSASSADASGPAANAVDASASSYWASAGSAAPSAMLHSFVVNLGASGRDVGGFRYLPRAGNTPGRIARYRLYLSEDGVNWGLPAAEGNFEDFGDGGAEKTIHLYNVARGKPAGQSSTSGSGSADRAVDGVVEGDANLGSVSHTDGQPNEWWEVDLGATHQLHAVRLWNRTDCCHERLNGAVVLLSETPMAGRSFAALQADPAVARIGLAGPVARSATLALNGRGRYLRVQLPGEDFLQLAEVEAFGVLAASNRAPTIQTPTPAVALQGQAVQLTLGAQDADGDRLSFAAAGLPPGLSLDAQRGTIAGTPTRSGAFNVTVSVVDSQAASDSASFVWTVRAVAPTIGSIAISPSASGSTVAYAPRVSGASGAQYRWNFGDGSATTAYASSSSISHRFTSAGIYTVTLTVRAADGSSVTRSFLQSVTTAVLKGAPNASSKLAMEWRKGSDARLWAVNPDNNSVSVFDVAGKKRLAEVTVGIQPSTLAFAPDGRLWVANTGSATISIIDVATQRVIKTLSMPRASQPYGLVFDPAGGKAFVALQASGKVLKLDINGALLASADVGTNPRHLSIGTAGDRLYVSRYISPPLPGEGTAAPKSADSSGAKGGEIVVLSPSSLARQRTIVLGVSTKTDTAVSGRGLPNYLGAAVIAPDGLSAWVPAKQDNVGRGLLRDGRNLDFQNTVRAISSRLDLKTQAEDGARRIDHDNAGVASAAAFHPNGAFLFVALESSRQVAVIDAARQRELFRIDTGRAPQGLLVAPDGKRLFVHNFMDRSVSVFDLTPLVQAGESRLALWATLAGVSSEKLAATVLKGKQLFYDARDPRLARDGYMSCASCHNDGSHDGRTWDLTGFGEGLRNTTSLRGRGGAQGNLHWTANFDEAQDFEAQIRSLAGGTGLMSNGDFNAGTRSQPLGDKKAGKSSDLDALAAYLASLKTFEPTPFRSTSGALTSAAVAGRAVFVQMNCASCHGGTAFTGSSGASALSNVGTLKAASGKRLNATLGGIDVPTLRDVWNSAPYLHDGSAATLTDAVKAHTTLGISSADAASVAAYLREIGSEESRAPAPVAATGTGLAGEYFAGTALAGTPKLRRTEAVNLSTSAAPGPAVPDQYSVRWSGTIEAPSSGTYYLRTTSNAGIRVWFNDAKVIDNWVSHTSTDDTTSALKLTAGRRYRIRIEYFDTGGFSAARLQWRLPGASSYVLVPANRLYP